MKSKKKLLLMGVGVMGALAMGVGATSTFAWYTVESSASIVKNDAGTGSMTVTEIDFALSSINIPMTITAESITTGLGQAHFGDTTDASIPNYDKGASPYLTTGYVDGAGNFVEKGYLSDGSPDLTGWKNNSVTTLTSTWSISVTINYAGSGWKTSTGTNASGIGDASYFQSGEDKYSVAKVKEYLTGLYIDVGIKPGASSRVCFIGAGDAKTGDNGIAAGLATLSSPDNAFLAAASNVQLDANGEWTGSTLATTRYYVKGGSISAPVTPDSGDLTGNDTAVVLCVRAHAA